MKYKRNMNLHSLIRPRLRQSWNKANLYNLAQFGRQPNIKAGKTFFQQKWFAKAATRAYHGEHIKERQWERMFSRRLPGVVEMDAHYLARFDGSEQASGRGSGREGKENKRGTWSNKRTPYMQMTYAPLERRLDVAIFRALFASSTREARMFVVHGGVKVNGKKMVHPAYQLNPGDMFQVDINRVMKATGRLTADNPFLAKLTAAVEANTIPESERLSEAVPEYPKRQKQPKAPKAPKVPPKPSRRTAQTDALTAAWSEDIQPFEPRPEAESEPEPAATEPAATEPAFPPITNERIFQLADVLYRARQLRTNHRSLPLRSSSRDKVNSIRELAFYAFRRPYLPNAGPALMNALTDVIKEVEEKVGAEVLSEKGLSSAPDAPASKKDQQKIQVIAHHTWKQQAKRLPGKPQFGFSWAPKDYMSPFAFIPRYLEVNPKICAAVYLRHPVARQGQAEVPTPFPLNTSQLAFNWYLRRR